MEAGSVMHHFGVGIFEQVCGCGEGIVLACEGVMAYE